jgi:hypothetical protein
VNAVWQAEHWIRTRAGTSTPSEKRRRCPHPGQVTEKDDAVAEV